MVVVGVVGEVVTVIEAAVDEVEIISAMLDKRLKGLAEGMMYGGTV